MASDQRFDGHGYYSGIDEGKYEDEEFFDELSVLGKVVLAVECCLGLFLAGVCVGLLF